jgi:D-beta-D-heptose 7-phosphate kinase/D-beta-D-heptose 1-phosphate adenosyltransferase
MKKIIVISGGFDPLHSGHILLCNSAKTYGDYLIVGLNSDDWLVRKKGQAFMPWDERRAVVSNLKAVDEVMSFDDSDGTACDLLEQVKKNYPRCQIVFANGGDRTAVNIPEMSVKDVIFQFGVGGENKANSSSWILQEWKSPKTIRPWGYYRVLHTIDHRVKVKELTVDPGMSLSMQRHTSRTELWFVAEGLAGVNWDFGSGTIRTYKQETILPNEWHQLHNPTDKPLKIIEIQYGSACDESDIERKP